MVHESLKDEFSKAVVVKVKEIYGERPNGSDHQGKMISDLHTNRMERIIKSAGGKILCGGNVNKEFKHCEPTVILEPNLEAEIMTDEIFGPILPIIPYKTMDECIDFINDRDKPLALYYFGDQNSANSKRV